MTLSGILFAILFPVVFCGIFAMYRAQAPNRTTR
jgi:hypothetical protein